MLKVITVKIESPCIIFVYSAGNRPLIYQSAENERNENLLSIYRGLFF